MQFVPIGIFLAIGLGMLITGIIYLREPIRLQVFLNRPSERRSRPERDYSERSLRALSIAIAVIGALLTVLGVIELIRQIVYYA